VGAYVVLRDGEDLETALKRFERYCRRDQRRPWTKRRYGYFEKPSALRRKRMRRCANFKISLEAQFRRTGPALAVGR
jgi:ribosomal protein S21